MQSYISTPDFYNDYIAHHGILGQKWGKKNGPPYPLGSGVSTGHRLKNTGSVKKKKAKNITYYKDPDGNTWKHYGPIDKETQKRMKEYEANRTAAGRKVVMTSKDGNFKISKEVMKEFLGDAYHSDMGKAIIMMKEDNPNFSSMYNGVKSFKTPEDSNTTGWFIVTDDDRRYALYKHPGSNDIKNVTFESIGTATASQKRAGYTAEDAKRWQELKNKEKKKGK